MSLLIRTNRSKNQLWVWGSLQLIHAHWALFILQFESYEIAFSWCLWQTLFPICFLLFTKICLIISSSNKYPPCWSFKPAESNQFKVDIKSRTGLTWNADMWLIFQRLHAQHSPLQMSNQIAKFNSWKLVVAKWQYSY